MLHIKPTTISSMPRVCSTINLLMLKRLLLLEAESKVVAGGPILLQRSYHQQHGFSKRYLRDKAELQRQQQRQKDLEILNLPAGCNDESQVRDAYLKLVKLYHPDGGKGDEEEFQKVDLAYKNLRKDFAEFRHNRHKIEGEYGLYYDEEPEVDGNSSKKETDEPDIKHTVPQHRQYLNYDGVGSGTPFEREKQHIKYKRAKAAENVMDYRVQKVSRSSGEHESALTKDTRASKKIKTGIGVERLVEDLIQESMARGDFENLSGKGKPLNHSSTYNPYVDFTTHKLNQVLIENGFAPEWILLDKEIREERCKLRQDLSKLRHKYGPVLTHAEETEWNCLVQKDFKKDCDTLNKLILKFNLTVPSLHKQMMMFQLDREAAKALTTFSPEIHQSIVRNKVKEHSEKRHDVGNHESVMGMLMSIFKM
ncbi:dnaJ homolog subfamily C member 28 [Folsomia candida]|uniref:dnaJ homolog subfamily C member 28 n=1 Tax=Folsomia candida TaxID=158441 RepID=UPI000B902C94|nr:dnaJ homolog subfamily C member 28 [Folsomia candida]